MLRKLTDLIAASFKRDPIVKEYPTPAIQQAVRGAFRKPMPRVPKPLRRLRTTNGKWSGRY